MRDDHETAESFGTLFFFIFSFAHVLSLERDLAFVCFARAHGEASMNMKRFVYGDDDFLRCSMFVILTSDVTSVVVHVAR